MDSVKMDSNNLKKKKECTREWNQTIDVWLSYQGMHQLAKDCRIFYVCCNLYIMAKKIL